jgi:hypothetical protein
VGWASQNLFTLVTPARLARQPCHAGVDGATRQSPGSATPASVNDTFYRGAPCRASACGVTKWCRRDTRASATKGVRFANTFFGISIKILF